MAGPSEGQLSQLLTIRELSTKCRLSVSTIHRLKTEGKIPFYQPAGKRGRLLFPPDAIERAAEASYQPSPGPSHAEGHRHLSGPPPTWMRPTP